MPADDYNTLATVYDWIVPEALTTPAGSSRCSCPTSRACAPGARVLDCAAGTGPLAVGLAQRGFDVTATDASAGMVDRTRALAAADGVRPRRAQCASGRTSARRASSPSTPSSASATRSRTRPGATRARRRSGRWRASCARAACSS